MTEGSPADPPVPPAEVGPVFGSTVTILFSDIRGFTEYTEQHGDEAAYRMLKQHNSIVEDQLALYRGHVVKTQGDSFMVSFDAARTAVACAVAIQRMLDQLHSQRQGATIQVGIGINVGEPVREGADFFGGTVNLASRICAIAGPGEILVSQTVRDVVRKMEGTSIIDIGPKPLKGFSEPQRLFRIDWSDGDHWAAVPAIVEVIPPIQSKNPFAATTATTQKEQASSFPSAAATPVATLPVGEQHSHRRRGQPSLLLVAVIVVAAVGMSGVVGAIALTHRNGQNGASNQAAVNSRASTTASPTAASSALATPSSVLSAPTGAVTKLRDLPTKSRAFDGRDPVTSNGEIFVDALGFALLNPLYTPNEADYDLGGRYERFQAQVLMDDRSNANLIRFSVFGDDKMFGDVTVDKGSSKNLDVVVTGVQILSLLAEVPPSVGCCLYADYVSARLYLAASASTPSLSPTLNSLDVSGNPPDYAGPVQASGTPYVDAVAQNLFNTAAPKQLSYTLGGHYQSLTLTEMVTDVSSPGFAIRIVVSADGNVISDNKLGAGDSKSLDLNMSGVKTVSFIVSAQGCCGYAAFASSSLG